MAAKLGWNHVDRARGGREGGEDVVAWRAYGRIELNWLHTRTVAVVVFGITPSAN